MPVLLGDVTVICNQTHKIQTVKASRLSLEEGELTEKHLTVGSQVLLEEKGNHFPVMIISKADKKRGQKRKYTAEFEPEEADKKKKMSDSGSESEADSKVRLYAIIIFCFKGSLIILMYMIYGAYRCLKTMMEVMILLVG